MRSGAAGESDDGIRLDPWRALAAEVGRRSKGRALISTVPTILPRLAKNGGRRRELQPVTASSPQTEVCSDDAFSARLFSGRRAYTQSALATGRLEAEASERLGRANVSICSAPSTPKRVRFRLSEERTKFFKSVATADRMPSVGRSCAPQTAKKEAHSPRGRHLIRSMGRRGSLKSASLGRSSGFKSASAARGAVRRNAFVWKRVRIRSGAPAFSKQAARKTNKTVRCAHRPRSADRAHPTETNSKRNMRQCAHCSVSRPHRAHADSAEAAVVKNGAVLGVRNESIDDVRTCQNRNYASEVRLDLGAARRPGCLC